MTTTQIVPDATTVQGTATITPFSLSVLTVERGNASKRLIEGAHGLPVKGQGSLAITAGVIEHVQVAGLGGLKTLLMNIRTDQALVHGVVKDSLPKHAAPLVTTEALKQAKPGTLEPGAVARSLEYINYPPGCFLLMLDRDDNPEDPTKVPTADALIARLTPLLPGIETAGRLMTTSTSSGIKSKATGEWLIPPTGSHTYFLARGDLKRFVDLLTVRLWNAGYGYCTLATPNKQTGVAAVLVRALVDLSVFSPERLDYVAGARIAKQAPFYQDRGEPQLAEGDIFDLDALPEVTAGERQQYHDRLTAAKAKLAPERFATVQAVVEATDATLTPDQVHAIVAQRLEHHDGGFLPPEYLLYFFHRTKAVAVKDLAADYDGLRLADPHEPDYRDGTDAIFHWRQGDWLINSFAHGLLRTYRAVPVPPPDPDEEDFADLLNRAAANAHRRGNGHGAPDDDAPLPYSDYTNARAFVQDHGGHLRYCYPWKAWVVWTGTHWERDASGAVMRMAKQTIKRLARHVEDLDDDGARALMGHIKVSLSTAKLKAMIECAQSEDGIPVQPEDLDTHRWLLNCRNGTLDLRTGTLRAHDRADLLTFVLPVDYDALATCPTWQTFLTRIMNGNENLINFLQRAIGYALTGVIREHVLLILWGTGRNGKSTFLNTLRTLLAAYAMKAPSELLMVSNNDRHPTERADLCGKRFVAAIETEQGRRLAEVFVKEATGGDPIRARRMREDFWEFQPTHKVFLATNHKPMIAGTDPAIWERIRLVPFTVTIPPDEIDTTLPEKLEAELPGILNWALQGCMTWQEHGLGIPDEVKAATAGYRSEMDVLGQFIDECCLVGANYRVKASDLYDTYKQWCTEHGEAFDVQRTWGMKLTDRGYESRKVQGRSWWIGIALPDRTPLPGKHDDQEQDTTGEEQVDEVDEGRRKNGKNRTSPLPEAHNPVSSSTSSTSSTMTDDDSASEIPADEPLTGDVPAFTSFSASARWCAACQAAQSVTKAQGVLSCTICGQVVGRKTETSTVLQHEDDLNDIPF